MTGGKLERDKAAWLRAKWARNARERRAGVWTARVPVVHYDYLTKCLIDAGFLSDIRNDGSLKSNIDTRP